MIGGSGLGAILLMLLFGAAPVALICILVIARLRRSRSGIADGFNVDELDRRLERAETQVAQLRLSLAETTGATDIGHRLKEAEAALAASQRRLEKLEAVVVDQLLDAPDPPVAIEEGRGSSRAEEKTTR